MKFIGNKVSSCVNDICEGKKVKTKKNKYSPEKIFIGYKKPSKVLVVKKGKTKKVMYASKKKKE